MVITGFDLVKEPEIILQAYNDPYGYSREFNLNLLTRMNNELGADFDRSDFLHSPVYDPLEQSAISYLVSRREQELLPKHWTSLVILINGNVSRQKLAANLLKRKSLAWHKNPDSESSETSRIKKNGT